MAIKPIDKEKDNSGLIRIGILALIIGVGFFLSSQQSEPNFKVRNEKVNVNAVKSDFNIKNQFNEVAEATVSKSQDIAGQIMGEATGFVNGIASKSADTVSSFLIEKSTEPIIEQIKKLPADKQEEVKKILCE